MLGALVAAPAAVVPMLRDGQKTQARVRESRLANILYTCLTPLDAVRGRLLNTQRQELFSKQALVIRTIQADAQRTVTLLLTHYEPTGRLRNQAGRG